MNCRHCASLLKDVFLDLGFAPPSNAYLNEDDLRRPEITYPLKVYLCDHCWLVQTQDFISAEELFRKDYAYFSSTSASWLRHASDYSTMIIQRLGLGVDSFVIEVAANDGYLLRNFIASGIPCLGIEPTRSTASAAEKLGIPIIGEFFGATLAQQLCNEGKQADLIIGNNVYAHVPDILSFTTGLKTILKPGGTITLEFPHLLNLIKSVQFDTIYHEHYSYLSLYTINNIFKAVGLRIFDIDELPTHGGSLRVYGCHADDPRPETINVAIVAGREANWGMQTKAMYDGFQQRVDQAKNALLMFLIKQYQRGKTTVGYGAAAKGSTLLNYAGVKPDLLPFVCDSAASKQGKYMPGSRIPILPPSALKENRPDIVLVLPWNIADEIIEQHTYVFEWGGKFVTALPNIQIWENS